MTEPADIGVLIADTSLVVRSWDRWLERASGIAAELACGRPLAELAPGFDGRGYRQRFNETLANGTVQVLSPTFHRYLVPCPTRSPSKHFAHMQQRVHVGPLIDGGRVEGVIVTITDVTAQLDAERQLAADLASQNPDARRAAEDVIAQTGRIESLEPFQQALAADDWKVRGAAVRSLARTADREALHALVQTLRRDHRSLNALSSALKLLAISDVEMTAPLAELLNDSDADLRIQAALALGEQHDPAAVEPLIRALDDADPNVRFHAIEALGRLRASDAVDRLAAVVEGGDFFLAFAAIDALALINDRRVASRLVPLLESETLREAVAAALGSLGDDDAVAPLVGVLNRVPTAAASVGRALSVIERRAHRELGDSSHIVEAVRTAVTPDGERHLLAALDAAGPDDLPYLVRVTGWVPGARAGEALAGRLGDAQVRESAVEALVRRGESAVDLLIACVRAEEDAAVTLAAVNTLGRIGSRRATAALLPLLDESADVAIAAAGALARIGDPAAFDALLDGLGHDHPAVRQAVVGALNSLGHTDMCARIAVLLDHEDPLVRESAVRVAGYFGYEATAARLISRTRDTAEAVRAAAIEHLPYLDAPNALEVLEPALDDASPKVRAAACRALARVDGAPVRAALLNALRDKDLWVRYYAARSLGETRDVAVASALSTSATTDAAPHVRIAALDALGTIGDASTLETVMSCAGDADQDVAAAALRTLGHLRTPSASHRLQQASRADSAKIRLAAVMGLSARGDAEGAAALAWVAGAEADALIADAAISALADIAVRDASGADAAIAALIDLHGDSRRAEAASTAIARLGPAGATHVAQGLRHAHTDVRRRTIDTLARMRTADATHFIVTALDDAADAVRETAVLALARLGARGVQPRLEQLAREDPSKAVRRAAAAATRSHQAG